MSDKHMQRQINLARARSNKPLHNISPRAQQVAQPQQSASRRSAFDVNADAARHMTNVHRGAQPQHSNAQQPQRRQMPPDVTRATQARSGGAAAVRGKSKKQKNKTLMITGIVFAIILALFLSVWAYYKSMVNKGSMGTLDNIEGFVETAPEFKGKQLNLLVLGIDYSTEDAVVRDPIGNTDMILYARFDFENKTLKMMQIPRDLCVGDVGGSAGKINGVFAHTNDTQNRVGALAAVIGQQYGLPVDNYLTIDMDSLREIVDIFGGLRVYVAEAMDYAGSAIPQGWSTLTGAECEFFLRNRKQYATGDIQRLANQRYFYSALFSRVRTATWQDIVKLMPLVQQYINTDLDITNLMGVAVNLLKIPSSNIMICQMPVSRGEPYNGQDVQVLAKEETAELFNQYFNDTETPVTVASFSEFDWPSRGEGVSGANVQWMNAVDADGADQEGATEDSLAAASQAAAEQAAAESAAAASQAASTPAA